MNNTSQVASRSGTLHTAGADIHFEVRGDGLPPLLLVGCPMDATAFAPLADLLAIDHTVITTDPRGINRSFVDDPDQDVTPDMLADDLARLLIHLNLGPVAVLGSSGGAVSALALAQHHPHLVHTVVAHEPPLNELLDDREQFRVGTHDIVATYLRGDIGGAWGKFFTQANINLTAEQMAHAPHEPNLQAAADERFFFAHTLRPTTSWTPDIAALRDGPVRIVIGVGADSTGQQCDRTSTALAAAITVSPTVFPGDHVGFMMNPDGFAARLRAVLSNA
jgi:pimeloyl-ACP methyl ester carboxylesterase